MNKKVTWMNKGIVLITVFLLSVFGVAGCTEEDIKSQLQTTLNSYLETAVLEHVSSDEISFSEISKDAVSSDTESASSAAPSSTSENNSKTELVSSESGGASISNSQSSAIIQENINKFYNNIRSKNSDANASVKFQPIKDMGFTEGNGTQTHPYIITTPEELVYFSEKVNSGQLNSGVYFALGADIDMSDVSFTPIGNSSHRFSSYFDGRGYTVSNLTPKLIYEDFGCNANYICGFFGMVENAEIKNLTLENVNITYAYESDYFSEIGILAACVYPNRECKITDCNVSGSINVEADVLLVGGIVGDIFVENDAKLVFERLQSNTKIQVRSDSVIVGAVSGSLFGKGTESLSDICARSEILHSTQYSAMVGAFGGVTNLRGNMSISNCFFNINTNKKYNDNVHPVIGGIINSYQPSGSFDFLNVFAFADDCSKLYEIPSENPVKEENCDLLNVLPSSCNFNTEIWDISDPAEPFIKCGNHI